MRSHGRAVRQAGVWILILTAALLAGCTPQPPVHDLVSPVGTWTAMSADTDVLRINEDGTFVIADASFDIGGGRDTQDATYRAEGDWNIAGSADRVFLHVSQDYVGDRKAGGAGGYSREFADGRITFRDGEDTMGITFVYDSEPSP